MVEKLDWANEQPTHSFHRVAKTSKLQLKMWSNVEFGGKKKKLKNLVRKLEVLKQNPNQRENGMEIK